MSNMQNIQVSKEDNYLVLRIDLTKNCGLSSTGKTIKIASTGGFKEVDHGVILNMNVNRKLV